MQKRLGTPGDVQVNRGVSYAAILNYSSYFAAGRRIAGLARVCRGKARKPAVCSEPIERVFAQEDRVHQRGEDAVGQAQRKNVRGSREEERPPQPGSEGEADLFT